MVAGVVVGSSAKSFVPSPQAVTIVATTTATRIARIMNLFSSRVNPPTPFRKPGRSGALSFAGCVWLALGDLRLTDQHRDVGADPARSQPQLLLFHDTRTSLLCLLKAPSSINQFLAKQ
jgi:hypothetical protein